MNKILAFSFVMSLLMFTTSCDHKDLYYDNCEQESENSVSVGVDVDWSKNNSYLPERMSLLVFPEGENLVNEKVSSNIDHSELSVPIGKSYIAVINKEIKDFSTILFRDITDYNEAEAVAKPIYDSWYNEFSAKGEIVAEQPELFSYDYKGVMVLESDKDSVITTLQPTCKVYTVNVKVRVKDIYKIQSVRGAITGFSEGISFRLNDTNEGLVSHLLDGWKAKLDNTDMNNGFLSCSFQTFGFTKDHKFMPADNKLRLFLTFKADDPREYTLEIGNLFVEDESNSNIWNLDLKDPIDLSDIKIKDGDTGGFDVDIDSWEDATESTK